VTASGVVIEGRRILTNAHVFSNATQVRFRRMRPATRCRHGGRVAPGIDLAVLQLDDASFFDTHPPVARASKLPQIKDAVWLMDPDRRQFLSITKESCRASSSWPTTIGVRPAYPSRRRDQSRNSGALRSPATKWSASPSASWGDAQSIGYIIPNEELNCS